MVEKIEKEIEIKASADEFYNVFKSKPNLIPGISSTHLRGVDHEQGDWSTHGHGSVKVWKYTIEDEDGTFREKVELDDEKKSVTLVGLDGEHVFKNYKTYKPVFHAIPKNGGSLVKLTIEYEKQNEDVPPPTKYMPIMVSMAKDIDDHLAKNKA